MRDPVSDVIDSFEQDDHTDPGNCEYVPIEPRKGARPGAVGQDLIPADALIVHGQFEARSVDSPGEDVRPAVIGSRSKLKAIGDRVSECHDYPGAAGGEHVHFAQEGASLGSVMMYGIHQHRERLGAGQRFASCSL